MDCSTPGFAVLYYLLEFAQTHVHWVSHFSLLLLPSIFPSIRVFSNELALHIRWPKYCSFSFSICPSNEYSGLISIRIDWWLVEFNGHLQSLYWPSREAPAFQPISCVLSWVWLWSVWLQKKYRGITLVIWVTFIFLVNFAEDSLLLLAKLQAEVLISTLLHRGRISCKRTKQRKNINSFLRAMKTFQELLTYLASKKI